MTQVEGGKHLTIHPIVFYYYYPIVYYENFALIRCSPSLPIILSHGSRSSIHFPLKPFDDSSNTYSYSSTFDFITREPSLPLPQPLRSSTHNSS